MHFARVLNLMQINDFFVIMNKKAFFKVKHAVIGDENHLEKVAEKVEKKEVMIDGE